MQASIINERANVSDRPSEASKFLQELQQLKPSRAVDRTFNENSVVRAFYIYAVLQEKIKKNTQELRSTLTRKYESLLSCSKLFEKVNNFTCQIKDIETSITNIMSSAESTYNKVNYLYNNIITYIESTIAQKRFIYAIKMTQDTTLMNYQEVFYMKYLQVYILYSIEKELISRRLTPEFMNEVILCVKLYAYHVLIVEWGEMFVEKDGLGHLLSILVSKMYEKYFYVAALTDNDVIEVIFKCKLCSLGSYKEDWPVGAPSIDRKEKSIIKFFVDLRELIMEQPSTGEYASTLYLILLRNLEQIGHELSHIFILQLSYGLVTFEYYLYTKLSRSYYFKTVLADLQQLASPHGTSPNNLTKSFYHLWYDYYQQLITYLCKQCSFINFACRLLHKEDKNNLPKEFMKYIVDSTSIQCETLWREYTEYLYLMFKNMNYLLVRTVELYPESERDYAFEAILSYYHGKMYDNIIGVSVMIEKELLNKQTLRKAIFCILLCSEYEEILYIWSQRPGFSQLKNLQLTNNINLFALGRFFTIFSEANFSITKWMISFDSFFVGFHSMQGSPAKNNKLQQIILQILYGLMYHLGGEAAKNFLASQLAKKQYQSDKLSNESTTKQNIHQFQQAFTKKKTHKPTIR